MIKSGSIYPKKMRQPCAILRSNTKYFAIHLHTSVQVQTKYEVENHGNYFSVNYFDLKVIKSGSIYTTKMHQACAIRQSNTKSLL